MTAAERASQLSAKINAALTALHNALSELRPLDEERILRIHTIANWSKAMAKDAQYRLHDKLPEGAAEQP